MSVLVSRALPKGVDSFSLIEDVWVVDPHCVYPVATALRQSLIEIANARMANEGRHTKMELVYDYLTGPRFRGHVQTIVEKFSEMEEDLASERRTMNRIWAKRERQIRGAIEATAGFYGDLEGIAGRSLKEIEGSGIPNAFGGNPGIKPRRAVRRNVSRWDSRRCQCVMNNGATGQSLSRWP